MPNCDLENVPNYPALEQGFRDLRRSLGLRVREVACVGAARTLFIGELGNASAPSIVLTAGVHGDEPAGPWALVSVLAGGLLDPRFAYRIWPCTNPSGYAAGTRCNSDDADVNRAFSRGGTTPESRAIITSNRDRRFALSIDVHEDHEADGFYCYAGGPSADGLGGAVTRAVVEAGFSLQDFAGFDFDEPGASNPNRRRADGIVVMAEDEGRHFDGLSLNLYLMRRAAGHVLTLETPRKRAWDERIAMHRVAIVAAIDYIATELASATNGTV